MTDLMIRTAYGEMPVYVAVPATEGPWPGVVVVHDFGGMGQDLRNQADWLPGARVLGFQRQLRRLPQGRRGRPGRRLPDRRQLRRPGPLADGPPRRPPNGERADRARRRP